MTPRAKSSRRRFLSQSVWGAAALGAGAAAARLTPAADAAGSETSPKPASFDTNTRRPRGIAVGTGGRVYIAADRSVHVYDAQGREVDRLRLQRPVRAVAVLPGGDLLVGLMHRVERYRQAGERVGLFCDLGADSLIAGVAASPTRIYVAEARAGVVHGFSLDGKTTTRLERRTAGVAATPEFFSLAADAQGVHVVQPRRHRVEHYSATGELVRSFGRRSRDLAGFSGCCNPVSLAVLSGGRIVTAERGLPRVKLYDADGSLIKSLAGPEHFAENARTSAEDDGYGCASGGLELAVDGDDRVFVLDRTTGRVTILT